MKLDELYNIIADRKKNLPENSYVTSLYKEGTDRIIQKVGEEATEVVIAAKNENIEQIVYEVSDLLFHTLMLLNTYNIQLEDIYTELEKRHK